MINKNKKILSKGALEKPNSLISNKVNNDYFAPDEIAKHELKESGLLIEGKYHNGISPLVSFEYANHWRACESVLKLRDQINLKAQSRSIKLDGFIGDEAHRSRDSDHNPWIIENNIGVVSAVDITHDPLNGCDCNLIVEALKNAQDERIKYIIWNRRILSYLSFAGNHPWEWRTYSGRNPHTKHFHVSVRSEKSQYDSQNLWDLSAWINE